MKSDVRYFQEVQKYDKFGEKDGTEYKSFHIFSPIYSLNYATYRSTKWVPYHANTGWVEARYLNTFPGFKAKLSKKNQAEIEDMVKPILTHIYEVWAQNNDENYKYIMTWLAQPIRDLKRTNTVLVLVGKQGTGKSIIFDFITDKVYGPNISTSVSGLTSLTQRFNSANSEKMFIVINEMPDADYNKASADFEQFKSCITEKRILVERKMCEPLETENHANYAICSNNENVVKIDNDDRRYAIFECSSKRAGDRNYFDKLVSSLTVEAGDAFYSYLRFFSDDFKIPLVNIPKTQAKSKIIETSQDRVILFEKALFVDGEGLIPEEYMLNSKRGPFITTESLYQIFKKWMRDEFPSGKIKNKTTFSRDLKSEAKSLEYCEKTRCSNGLSLRGYYIKEEYFDTTHILTMECRDDCDVCVGDLCRRVTLKNYIIAESKYQKLGA